MGQNKYTITCTDIIKLKFHNMNYTYRYILYILTIVMETDYCAPHTNHGYRDIWK